MWPPTSTPLTLAEALSGWPPPAMDAAGPAAEAILTLTWVLLGMAGLVLVLVVAAVALALFGRPSWRARRWPASSASPATRRHSPAMRAPWSMRASAWSGCCRSTSSSGRPT